MALDKTLSSRSASPLFGWRLLIMIVTALTASVTAATVTPALNPTPEKEVKSTLPEFEYALRISNDTTNDLTVVITPGPTLTDSGVPCPTARRCTLAWHLGPDELAIDQPKSIMLAKQETRLLTYRGHAEAFGAYQSQVLIAEGSQAAQRYNVNMRRVPASLGADALIVGPVSYRTLGVFGGASAIPFTIINRSGQAVQLRGVSAQLVQGGGAGTNGNRVAPPATRCDDLSPLGAGVRRECSLTLPAGISPGQYHVTVTTQGSGVEPVEKIVDFSVRYSWVWAFIFLIGGGVIGKIAADYRDSVRRRRLQEAMALRRAWEAKEILEPFDAAEVPDSRSIIGKIRAQLAQIIEDLEANRAADHGAALDRLVKRIPALRIFAALEKEFRTVNPADAAQAYSEARAAVAADELAADAGTKLDALSAAIDAARSRARPGPPDEAHRYISRLEARPWERIERSIRMVDLAIDVAVILFIGAAGIVTLWQPDLDWGSFGDFLLALATGMGATITGATGLKELLSGYRLATITRT